MKTLVVYDSKFGNTEEIARTIANALGHDAPVCLECASDGPLEVEGIDLLVIGGPTQAHGMSAAMSSLLYTLSQDEVCNMAAATFDTRFKMSRLISGSAAHSIARKLERKGAHLVAPPESFFVAETEGPLLEGEIERAAAWGQALMEKVEAHARELSLV